MAKLSGNKPLPEPMLTQISVAIWRHWASLARQFQSRVMNIVNVMVIFSKFEMHCLEDGEAHPIPKHKCFSSRLAVVFAQSIEEMH